MLRSKFFIAACAVLTVVLPRDVKAHTTDGDATQSTATEVFNPHWFMQPQIGASYTLGETSFGDLVSPAAALSVGYRFTPAFGLRAGVSGWQARGSWVAPRHDYKYNYLQGNIDAMLSLTNLACGFNPSRTLDLYAFLGIGGAVGFHNGEAVDLSKAGCGFEKLWTGKKFFPAGRGGIGLDINVSRTVAINIEVNANALPDKFNSKNGSKADWQFNALAGITYSFGGRSKAVAPIVEIVDEKESAPAPMPQPAPAPVPAPAPTPVPEKTAPAPMTQDIFFTINSSVINSDNQTKVDALIEYLKANPDSKVNLTGYADKATGSAAYNMKISQRRAEAVATALRNAGIAPSRISTEAKGDTVQPFDEVVKNRVAIAITK